MQTSIDPKANGYKWKFL